MLTSAFTPEAINHYLGSSEEVEEGIMVELFDTLNALEVEAEDDRTWMETIFGKEHEEVYIGGTKGDREEVERSKIPERYQSLL